MSTPLPQRDDEEGRCCDPHLRRAEFRRRLAEKGIFVGMPRTGIEWDVPEPFPVSADEASAMVIQMRHGDHQEYCTDTSASSRLMSTPLPLGEDEEPWADADAFHAEFQRRLAQKGIVVRLPNREKEWEPPIPFPVSADEASAMVVRMRRGED